MRNWLQKRKAEKQAEKDAESARRTAEAEAKRKGDAELRQLKTNVLEILSEGKLPQVSFTFSGGTFPFKLLKSERLVWVFQE